MGPAICCSKMMAHSLYLIQIGKCDCILKTEQKWYISESYSELFSELTICHSFNQKSQRFVQADGPNIGGYGKFNYIYSKSTFTAMDMLLDTCSMDRYLASALYKKTKSKPQSHRRTGFIFNV